jgi:sec-independent protein translocase protein TatB
MLVDDPIGLTGELIMFGIGFGEILVIAFIAFMLVGPRGMPDMAKQFGKWFVKFRRMTFDVKSGVDNFVRQAEADLRDEELSSLKKELTTMGTDIKETVNHTASELSSEFHDPQSHLYPENNPHHHEHHSELIPPNTKDFEAPLTQSDLPKLEPEKK